MVKLVLVVLVVLLVLVVLVVVSSIAVLVTSSMVLKSILSKLGDFEEVGFNDFELGDLDDLELDLEDVDELEPVFVWLCRLRDKARASVSIISTASSTVMGLRGMV